MNKEVYNKLFDIEHLKISLKNELENTFEIEVGITATWLDFGLSLKNPLEKVLFFKKPLYDNQSVIVDDTPYQNVYPMNE